MDLQKNLKNLTNLENLDILKNLNNKVKVKIWHKIVSGFALMLAVIVVLSVVSILNSKKIETRVGKVTKANEIYINIKNMIEQEEDYIIEKNPNAPAKIQMEALKVMSDIDLALK